MTRSPEPLRPSSRIDRFLPDFDFTEHHQIDLVASPSAVYQAARHLDFSESKVTRVLFMIRRIHGQPLTIDAMTDGGEFSIIDELPPHEFVIGHATAGRTPIALADGDHFRSLEPPKGLKIAWNFRTELLSEGHTRLHTETRTACYGRGTRAIFRVYWTFVRPFSGYIRKEMLKAVRVGGDPGASSESPEAGATT